MQSQVSEVSPVLKQISVVVEGDRLVKELDKAYRKLSDTAKIKGFRQGKVPRQVLERYFRKGVEEDVLGRVITDAYREAVTSNKLDPVGQPEIKAGEFVPGQDFQFMAKVEVRPEITLKRFTGLSADRVVKTITDADVDREVDGLRQRMGTIEPVADRDVVANGDLATCNFIGTVDDTPFVGGSGSAYVIEVGAGRFVPGVEEAMVGQKLGQAFEVDAPLPEDFRTTEVAGKTAHWRVTVMEVKIRRMPELDDEFAKDLGEYESLADLRTKLKERMEAAAKQDSERALSEMLMEALIEANPFEVPPSMVERQIDFRVFQMLSRLPPEQARRLGADRTRLREDARDGAVRAVRGALLLDAVANQEKVEVTEKDMEDHIQKLAEGLGQTPERIRSQLSGERRDELKVRLRNDKAMDHIIANADITEKPA